MSDKELTLKLSNKVWVDGYLVALMIQNGKYVNRSNSQERANSAKHKLAPNSFSEYLKILADSINTSLAS